MKNNGQLHLPSLLIMSHNQLEATGYQILSKCSWRTSTISSSQHPLAGYLVLVDERHVKNLAETEGIPEPTSKLWQQASSV